MNKSGLIKSGLLALTLSFGWPALEAKAQEFNSIYVAPRLIYSKQNGDMSKATYSDGLDSFRALGGEDSDTNFGLGVALGLDLSYSTAYPVRVEAEYVYRSEASFKNSPRKIGGTGVSASQSFKVAAHSLMANAFYDINTDTPLTPYFGGGLGMAFLDAKYKSSINGAQTKKSSTDWNLAWNVGAGVAYQFNDSLALDFGYRYVDLGSSECGVSAAGSSGASFKTDGKVDYTTHEFSLGLRFNGF